MAREYVGEARLGAAARQIQQARQSVQVPAHSHLAHQSPAQEGARNSRMALSLVWLVVIEA
jgi:hypothetical protein